MFIETTTEPRQTSELMTHAVALDQFEPREIPKIVRAVVLVVPVINGDEAVFA